MKTELTDAVPGLVKKLDSHQSIFRIYGNAEQAHDAILAALNENPRANYVQGWRDVRGWGIEVCVSPYYDSLWVDGELLPYDSPEYPRLTRKELSHIIATRSFI